jgi:hypothetical protein
MDYSQHSALLLMLHPKCVGASGRSTAWTLTWQQGLVQLLLLKQRMACYTHSTVDGHCGHAASDVTWQAAQRPAWQVWLSWQCSD